MEVRGLVGGVVENCGPRTSLHDSSRMMDELGIGSIAVVTDGELKGILTERDVMRAVARGADAQIEIVEDWMTPDPDTVQADMDVEDAAAWLLATGYRHLPVMDGATLLGIASIKDVLWAVTNPAAATVED